ncbi:MAG: riboflavin biosynthesis protein RibF [Lachnospiraceae bacterium]|nr:riboflavin biosynthesis protein RibF [Lachnospiraceae bacterium]
MQILNNLSQIHTDSPTAVAIGKFDGVHLGHRRLLEEILSAKQDGMLAAVFTFHPSPEELFGVSDGKVLTPREEKRKILEALGVDVLIEYPMTKESASIAPEEFVEEYLCRRLKAHLVAAGTDLSFGARGKGDFALLDAMKRSGGYETVQVEKLRVGNTEVSSSRVRALIEAGELKEANACLGYAYSFTGIVQHGAQLGRTIGIPTVNLIPAENKLLPPYGVYFSEVLLDGEKYRAMTNIGTKPTVNGTRAVTIESYLYDYSGDCYDHEITVIPKYFHRPEMKFESVDALKIQMDKDLAVGRNQ